MPKLYWEVLSGGTCGKVRTGVLGKGRVQPMMWLQLRPQLILQEL